MRLSTAHAAILWGLVKEHKMANTRVELIGRIPSRNELLARRELGTAPRPTARDRGDIANNPANDPADNPDVTGDMPPPQQQAGGWHEYREGGRVYYYRDGPEEVRRIEPPRAPLLPALPLRRLPVLVRRGVFR